MGPKFLLYQYSCFPKSFIILDTLHKIKEKLFPPIHHNEKHTHRYSSWYLQSIHIIAFDSRKFYQQQKEPMAILAKEWI